MNDATAALDRLQDCLEPDQAADRARWAPSRALPNARRAPSDRGCVVTP